VDTHRLRQGLRRTPAVQTPTVRTPTLWTPTAVPGAPADSQGVRGVRFRSHPDTGRGVRLGQDGGGPAAPLRRGGRTAQVGFARPHWSSGQVDAASGERLSGWVNSGRGLANTGSPHVPALRTPATAAGHGDTTAAATLDSRQQDRPPPGNGVRPERDPNVRHRPPPRPADRLIRSLGAAGKLASSWTGSAGQASRPLR